MGTASAETITYDGTQPLQTAPDTTSTANSLFPGTTAAPLSSGNTITIDFSAGPNPVRVFGGISNTENSVGNTVNLIQGTVTGRIYGGYGGTVGNAESNVVNISGGSVGDRAVGGHSINGDSRNNSLSMSGGTVVRLYGGTTGGAASTSSGNSVTVSGSAVVSSNVYGGSADLTGTASGNSVLINGGQVGDGQGAGNNGWVIGGYSAAGLVEGNRVTIAGGTVNHVEGGDGRGAGLVSGNRIDMSGGTVVSGLTGGFSDSSEALANTVNVSGGSVGNGVMGGYVFSGAGSASSNTVHISGSADISGAVTGGHSQGMGGAEDNTVIISGGTIEMSVMGGSGYGLVGGNRVIVSGGLVGTQPNGGLVSGGSSGAGNAIGNSVLISGNATVGLIHGASAMEGAASNNSVSIGDSATVTGNVYGGFAGQNAASATHNTVTLFGAPTLSASTLYGGGSTLGATGDLFTGNTLNVNAFQGAIKGVHNFQNYNFVLPASVLGGGPVLTITGAILTDLTGTNVTVTGVERGALLAPGSRVTLIDKTQNAPASFSASNVWQGISVLYEMRLLGDPDSLTLEVASAQSNPQLKSLSEGRLAGLALVNQGADLIIGPGLHSALLATQRQNYGFAPFVALSGGSSRYDTGSHVDVDGVSLMAGLAWRAPLEQSCGSFLAGAFFEAGWGSYDSYYSFNSLPSVRGDGDTSYFGGGLLARYERPVGPGGLYGEVSFRAGQVDTDFSSRDIGRPGTNSGYDSGSAYHGAHAGLGYLWNINDRAALDFSTKYIWTHEDGDSVTVAGDRIDFQAADSRRWRTGARLSYAANEIVTPYVGAYYDHEFDGQANAKSAYGLNIEAPDLKGGTGVGELGLTIKPSPDDGFALDLGLQGYAGVRQGVAGSFQIKYEF